MASQIPAHIEKLIGSALVTGGNRHLDPLKPASDERSYRTVRLTNGLRATLISDPKADRAAAAMTIGAGHLADPFDTAGLSHACEHFCFQGSALYPDESVYKRLVKAAGGQTNASTASETVTYHFQVNHDKLASILDVWAQFFVAPLFREDVVERELNAITNEDARNRTEDGRRLYQLEKATCNPSHVFSKFGTGNMGTLRKSEADGGLKATRQAVIDLHKKYYRAPLMSLSVIGRESLDELEKMVTGQGEKKSCDFNLVPALEGTVVDDAALPLHYSPIDKSKGHPYPGHLLSRIYWLTPLKEQRTLTMRFPLVDFPMVEPSAALNLLSSIIGFEGKGSLLALLKRLGFADALSAGSDKLRHFSMFEVDIRLTQKGLENAQHVVALVFRYLQLLRDGAAGKQKDHIKAFHAERASLAASNVRFAATVPPVNAVLSVAAASQIYPSPLAVIGGSIPAEYDEGAFLAALATLHPKNLHLTVQVRDPLLGFPTTSGDGGAPQPSTLTPTPTPPSVVIVTTAASGGTKPPPDHIPPIDPMMTTASSSSAAVGTTTTAGSAATDSNESDIARRFALSEEAYRGSEKSVESRKERFYGFDFTTASISTDHLKLWGEAAGSSDGGSDAFLTAVSSSSASSASPFLSLLHRHLAADKWHLGPLSFEVPTDDYIRGLLKEGGDHEGAAASTSDALLTLPPLNPFIAAEFTLADRSTAARLEAKAMQSEKGLQTSWEEIAATGDEVSIGNSKNKSIVLSPSVFDFPTSDDAVFKASAALLGTDASTTAVPTNSNDSSLPAWAQPLAFQTIYPQALALPLPESLSGSTSIATDDETTGLPSPSGVYLKQDSTFKLPKSFVTFRFALPSKTSDGSRSFPSRTDFPFIASWQRSFLSMLIEDLLGEALKYQASTAGLVTSVSLEGEKDVLRVAVRGYSQKVPELLKATISFLKEDLLDEKKYPRETVMRPLFNRIKDKWRRSINNRTKAQPYTRCDYLLGDYFSSSNCSDEEVLKLIELVSLEQVLGFWQEAVLNTPPTLKQTILYGNVDYHKDPDRMIEIVKPMLRRAPPSSSSNTSNYFVLLDEASDKARQEIKSAQLPGPDRGILLRTGTDITLTERHPSPHERNCAVVMNFQVGIWSPRTWALTKLLHQVLSEPFFSRLRTIEQLGYITRANIGNHGTVTMISLEVQSANSSVAHIEERMQDFIVSRFLPPAATKGDTGKKDEESSSSILSQLTDEKLSSIAGILASQALEPDKTQLDELSRIQRPITAETFDFYGQESYAAALKAITKEDLIHFAEAVLRPTSLYLRRVTCRVVAPAADTAAAVSAPPIPAVEGAPVIINGGGPSVWPSMDKELGLTRSAFFSCIAPKLFDDATGDAEGEKACLKDFVGKKQGTDSGAGSAPWLGTWAPTMAELVAVERALKKRATRV
jgi:secreted Zn-dependent insulinase-like peptidase